MPKRRKLNSGQKNDKMVQISSTLHRLSETQILNSVNADSEFTYRTNYIDWLDRAKQSMTPDSARAAIHYGAQSIFDALLDNEVPPERRREAVGLFKILLQIGKEFLPKFYTGRAEVRDFTSKMRALEQKVQELDSSIPYHPKKRFTENPGMNARDIHSCLTRYLELAQNPNTGVFVPDYIMGCWSGSLEIVLALSGLIGVDAGFMRRSKTRRDHSTRMLPEQERLYSKVLLGAKVLCIEDWIQSGRTLVGVMDAVAGYSPIALTGMSIGYDCKPANLTVVRDEPTIKLFSMK